jgi:hypothetical protein
MCTGHTPRPDNNVGMPHFAQSTRFSHLNYLHFHTTPVIKVFC